MAPQPGTLGPLVGRTVELERLASLVGIGSREPGAASGVLLAGDAGVGKSRLVAEVAEQARSREWQVLVGHCIDFGDAALPYLPFTEVFGRLAAESPAFAEAVVAAHPALARLLPGHRLLDGASPTVERLDRAELFDAVAGALGRIAAAAPVLLVVEDLHWADPSTREMVSFLLARSLPERVSFVGSYRSDDLHRRHPLRAAVAEWSRLPGVSRMQLPPLPDADVRTLVAALHPTPLPEAETRRIVERAEGNAFFTEELVAAADLGGRALPTDLADLLLLRLDSLDDGARAVVRAASVAGRRVSHDLLAKVAGLDGAAFDPAVRAAVDANVLVSVGGGDDYAFRHALLAEAVYGDLLPGQRVRLHAAYAAALGAHDAAGTAAELARHARAAHDVPIAVRASIAAGDEAMALAGPDEAARHYELALELLPSAGVEVVAAVDLPELTVKASEAAAAAGDVLRAVALVQDQLRQLPADSPPADRARLLQALATAALLGETGIDLLEVTTALLRLVPAEPPTRQRAQVAHLHARANVERHREEAASRWAGEARELAERLGLPDVLADATTTLARLDERAGDPASALRILDEAVRTARAGGHLAAELRGSFNLASLHYELGHLRTAREGFTATAQRARERGRPWAPYGLDARQLAAVVAYVMGDWDDAAHIASVGGEAPPASAKAALVAAGLAVAAGRGERTALDRLAEVRPYWDHDGLLAILSGGAGIDLHGDSGDPDAALAEHDAVVASVSALWQDPAFQARIRLAALALGQLGTAAARAGSRERLALLRRGEELAEAAAATEAATSARPRGPEGMAWVARVAADRARLRWICGVDSPGPAALVAAWEGAVAEFERFGHVFEVARSRARLAAVLRAAGQPSEADEQARAAWATAHRLGAAPLVAELGANAASLARREPADRRGQRLTAREQEVLELVAQGRSNRAIGQQLFISPKTVSVHVSAILAKLGADGRTEAVAVARRRGLLAGDRG